MNEDLYRCVKPKAVGIIPMRQMAISIRPRQSSVMLESKLSKYQSKSCTLILRRAVHIQVLFLQDNFVKLHIVIGVMVLIMYPRSN